MVTLHVADITLLVPVLAGATCGFGTFLAVRAVRPGELTIQVGVASQQPSPPDEDSFAWQVLTTLATKASASTDDRRLTITLSMRSSIQEPDPDMTG